MTGPEALIAELLFWANVLSAAGVIAVALPRRSAYLEFPFLFSTFCLLWYLPQTWSILNDPSVAVESVSSLLLMSLLSLWGVTAGWSWAMRRPVQNARTISLPISRLLLPVFAITLFAAVMNLLISAQPVSVRASNQWTGPITIFAFFATIGVVSLVLSMAMFVTRPSLATGGLAVLNLGIYFPQVFIYFRRSEIFDLTLAVLLCLWFVRRFALPRPTLVAGCLLSFVLLNGVGQLRDFGGGYEVTSEGRIEARLPTLEELASVDWVPRMGTQDTRGLEARNGVEYMEASYREGSLSLGAQFWNELVQAYVPAQILGRDTKQGLMIGVRLDELASSQLYWTTQSGGTATGFVQAFHDFSYIGAGVFLLAGFSMGWLYRAAHEGRALAFLLYASMLTNGIHMVSHSSYYLFTNSVLVLLTAAALRKRLTQFETLKPLSSRRRVATGGA